MLNSIGLQGPGIEGLLAQTLPALATLGLPRLGLRRRLLCRRLRRHLRATRRARGRRSDRAQPLVPERRGGARDLGPDRRRLPHAYDEAPLREALAGDLGHRRVREGGRRGGCRRPLAREYDPGHGPRPAHLTAKARTWDRRLLRAGAPADRARVRLGVRSSRRRPDRRNGRSGDRPRRAGARRCGRLRCLTGHRALRRSRRSGAHPRGARRRGRAAWVRKSARRSRSCQSLAARNPCKSPKTVLLDPARGIVRLVRPWSRRRFRPKPPPGHSTSGWRLSSGRTTFESGAHS